MPFDDGPNFDPRKIDNKTYVRDHRLIRIVVRAAAEAEIWGETEVCEAHRKVMAEMFKEMMTPQLLKDKYRELYAGYLEYWRFHRLGVKTKSSDDDIPF